MTWDPGGEQFDAVISQFGVMFFTDPDAAFANFARLTVPGGRLRVVVWAQRSQSPIFDLPLSIALAELERADVTVEVPAPDAGPYSLSDAQHVENMLAAAGWTDVRWEPRPLRLSVGGGAGPADAAAGSLEFGPTRHRARWSRRGPAADRLRGGRPGVRGPCRQWRGDAARDTGDRLGATARDLRFRHDGNAPVPMVPASAPGNDRSGTAAGVLLPALPPVGLGRPSTGR